MATTNTTINTTLTYTDYSQRTYKIPVQDGTTNEAMKTALRNFNVAAASASSSVAQTFLSDGGAPVASINEAVIVERTEDVIYSVN